MSKTRIGPAITWFIVRRLLATVILLLVLSLLVFCLLYLAPGDVAHNLLGVKAATPEAIAEIQAQYHLNEPFIQQFWRWLSGVLTGDLGTSIRSGLPVTEELGSRLGVTVKLVALAFIISAVVGIAVGVLAAVRRGKALDRFLVSTAVVGVSAPGFAVGLILLFVFAVTLQWFPAYGTGDGFFDSLWHVTLPALALAVGLGAFVVQLTRTSVAKELDADYVTFARSRGLSTGRILSTVLRNAAVPIVTSLGLVVSYLIGGTILVETTFSLPGLGNLLQSSVLFKDTPVVQALTLLVGLVVALTSLVVDLVYLAIDPRMVQKVVR